MAARRPGTRNARKRVRLYRTVSRDGAVVVVGIPPIDLLAASERCSAHDVRRAADQPLAGLLVAAVAGVRPGTAVSNSAAEPYTRRMGRAGRERTWRVDAHSDFPGHIGTVDNPGRTA